MWVFGLEGFLFHIIYRCERGRKDGYVEERERKKKIRGK
jgi:hypothetical protein